MARRWRSPPESAWPRSPMTKSQPPGFLRMKLERLGAAGGVLELGLGGVRLADQQVLADRAVEQAGLLEHDGHGVAQRGQGDVAHVRAVDQDAAGVGVAQALEEGQRRGLARAGGADQGHGAAGLGGEGEVEHALVGAGEAVGHALELDPAGDLGQGHGARRVAHVALWWPGASKKASTVGAWMKKRPRKPVSWSRRPISRLAKPMKLTISPTVISPRRARTRTDGEDHHHDDGGRGAGQDGEQRPPGRARDTGRRAAGASCPGAAAVSAASRA